MGTLAIGPIMPPRLFASLRKGIFDDFFAVTTVSQAAAGRHGDGMRGHWEMAPDARFPAALSLDRPAPVCGLYADSDELLVHIQPGYLGKDGVHSEFLRKRVSEDVAKGIILLRVLPGSGATIPGTGRRPDQTL